MPTVPKDSRNHQTTHGSGTSSENRHPQKRYPLHVEGASVFDLPPYWDPILAAYSRQPAFYPKGHQPPPNKFYKDVRRPLTEMGQTPMQEMAPPPMEGMAPMPMQGMAPMPMQGMPPPPMQGMPPPPMQWIAQPPVQGMAPLPMQGMGLPPSDYSFGYGQEPALPYYQQDHMPYLQQGSFHEMAPHEHLQGPPPSFHQNHSYGGYPNSMDHGAPSLPYSTFVQPPPFQTGPQGHPSANVSPPEQQMSLARPHPQYPAMQASQQPPWHGLLEQIPREMERVERELGIHIPPGLFCLPFVIVDRQQPNQSGLLIENLDETRGSQQQTEPPSNTAASKPETKHESPQVKAVDPKSANTSMEYQDATDVWDLNATEGSCDLNTGFTQSDEESQLEKIPDNEEGSSGQNAKVPSPETSFHTPDSKRTDADVQNVSQESCADHNNLSSSTPAETTQEYQGRFNDSLMTDSSVEDYDDALSSPPAAPMVQIVPYINDFVPGDLTTITEEGSSFEDSRNSAVSRMSGSMGSVTPTPESVNGSMLQSKEDDGQRTPTDKAVICSDTKSADLKVSIQPVTELQAHLDSDSSIDWDTLSDVSFVEPTVISGSTDEFPTSAPTDSPPPEKIVPPADSQPMPSNTLPVNNPESDSSVDWDTSIEASYHMPAIASPDVPSNSSTTTERFVSQTIVSPPPGLALLTAQGSTTLNQSVDSTKDSIGGRKEVKDNTLALAEPKVSPTAWTTVSSKGKKSLKCHTPDIPTASAVDRVCGIKFDASAQEAEVASTLASLEMYARDPPTSLASPSTIATTSSIDSSEQKNKNAKQKKAKKVKAAKGKKKEAEKKKQEQEDADMEYLNSLSQNTKSPDDEEETKKRLFMLADYCGREQIRREQIRREEIRHKEIRHKESPPGIPGTQLLLEQRVDDFLTKHSVISKKEKDQAEKFMRSRLAHHQKSSSETSKLAIPLYKILLECSHKEVIVDVLCLRTNYTLYIEIGWLCEVFSDEDLLQALFNEDARFGPLVLYKQMNDYISRTHSVRSNRTKPDGFFDEIMYRFYLTSIKDYTEEERKDYPRDIFEKEAEKYLTLTPFKLVHKARAKLLIAMCVIRGEVIEQDKFIFHKLMSSIKFKTYLDNIFPGLNVYTTV